VDFDFSDIQLQRGGRTIVDGVSGHLAGGQIVVILGANGAGKTSLLHCLAGLQRDAGGVVHLDGRRLDDITLQERARLVGFLPQRGEVHWNLSVHALVALGRMAHNGGGELSQEDEHIIASVMEQVDIAHLSERQVLTLSGGEQARALFARVLAGVPRWLLADEPLASLDPAHQRAMLDILAHTAKAGTGVITVLHDVNHAMRIANHVILMRAGCILAQGPRDVVLTAELLEQTYGIEFEMTPDGRAFLLPYQQHVDMRQ